MRKAGPILLPPISEGNNGNSNNDDPGLAAAAAVASGRTPPYTNPGPVAPSGRPDGPPPSVNILRNVPTTGLTNAQRCTAADADMRNCIGPTEEITSQIAALEKQAAVVCTQCDQIRTQITNLRAQIAVPAVKGTQIGAVPPTIAPGASAVCNMLPALRKYETSTDSVPQITPEKYKEKINSLVKTLSTNSRPQVKALREELKSYDPPGAFMRTFGRRAKDRAPLRNVAQRVSVAIGCPPPVTYGPPTIDQAVKAAEAAALVAASKEANAQKYGAAAQTFVTGVAGESVSAAARAAELRRKAEEMKDQANLVAGIQRAKEEREARNAEIAAKAAQNAARRASARNKTESALFPIAANNQQSALRKILLPKEAKADLDRMEGIVGPLEMGGGARRTRKIRKYRKATRKQKYYRR
jgi:hypothetical protein